MTRNFGGSFKLLFLFRSYDFQVCTHLSLSSNRFLFLKTSGTYDFILFQIRSASSGESHIQRSLLRTSSINVCLCEIQFNSIYQTQCHSSPYKLCKIMDTVISLGVCPNMNAPTDFCQICMSPLNWLLVCRNEKVLKHVEACLKQEWSRKGWQLLVENGNCKATYWKWKTRQGYKPLNCIKSTYKSKCSSITRYLLRLYIAYRPPPMLIRAASYPIFSVFWIYASHS